MTHDMAAFHNLYPQKEQRAIIRWRIEIPVFPCTPDENGLASLSWNIVLSAQGVFLIGYGAQAIGLRGAEDVTFCNRRRRCGPDDCLRFNIRISNHIIGYCLGAAVLYHGIAWFFFPPLPVWELLSNFLVGCMAWLRRFILQWKISLLLMIP